MSAEKSIKFTVLIVLFYSYWDIDTKVSVGPSKNRLAKNMQVLQVFFLQDFQDIALNLAHILQVLPKMNLFLQEVKNLVIILQEKFAR